MASTCISARTRSLRISFPSAECERGETSKLASPLPKCTSASRGVTLPRPGSYSSASYFFHYRTTFSRIVVLFILSFFSLDFLLLVFKLLLPPPLPMLFRRQRSVAIDIETSFGGSLPLAVRRCISQSGEQRDLFYVFHSRRTQCRLSSAARCIIYSPFRRRHSESRCRRRPCAAADENEFSGTCSTGSANSVVAGAECRRSKIRKK